MSSAPSPSFLSNLSPLQLILSGGLLLLLFLVFGLGIRFRNHPAVSLHCILLGLIISLAIYFVGQFFANWQTFSIANRAPRHMVDPFFMNGHIALARAIADVQTLFSLLLTAILVLMRTRQTKSAVG